MTDATALVTVFAERDAETLGLTVRVLADGRIQIVTGDREWTLHRDDSYTIASTVMSAMEGSR
ncbi:MULTISPECIES: hypothetical protein [unclassified Plantactinospora]|jgi:hypothetical protein|uniref:hypothetical protein n=1 Tax=unclassified Plantactinospora TaxID=2631981 RepID=UPI002980DE6F|nr:hypothetical protein [Plantactinospora sp. KLBMP9567]MDW5330108.1 hypothetical protein [Plantactinospora sp. KLBMP9567]